MTAGDSRNDGERTLRLILVVRVYAEAESINGRVQVGDLFSQMIHFKYS